MSKQNLLPGLGGGANSWLASSPVGPRIAFDPLERSAAANGQREGAVERVNAAAAHLGVPGLDRPPAGHIPGAARVDAIQANASGGVQGFGNVAQRMLQSGFNIDALRTNATLMYDEWRYWDRTVLEVVRARMVGIADLFNAGLVFDLPNALGHTVLSWQRMSDMTGADVTMSGISEAENDRLTFDLVNMPIPIIHKDFNMNVRELAASRNGGMPLDTAQISYATKVVTERIEQILFNGTTNLGANATIYGYTTTPTRLTGSVTASWALSATTGASILGDVLAMIGAANAQNMYGPWQIYVGTAAFVNLGNDFKANGDRTTLERLLAVPGVAGIKAAPWLGGAAGQVVMVQMTREVVDLVNGFQPTVVEWESHGGMVTHYKVMAIQVPRMRTDQNTAKGIIHYS
jgi:uncharacterized linocin/CFP29 family protein